MEQQDPKRYREVLECLRLKQEYEAQKRFTESAPPAVEPSAKPVLLRRDGRPRGKTGPPSGYDPSYHPGAVVKMMAQGMTLVEVSAQFGIKPKCLQRWRGDNPEMDDAVREGQAASLAWWVNKGRVNIDNTKFNTGLYCFMMANMFGWSRVDPQDIRLSGGLRNVEERHAHVHYDLTRLSREELAQLRSARELADKATVRQSEAVERDEEGKVF
jgi:hypothetical protein